MEKKEMSNQVVKVKRETIAACMTCPLCNKLLRDATTISECLHTFCRKCIQDKITEEELECCPVCNIDLGCAPLEKLRPDHNLQDLRAKIFPLKGTKVKAPDVVPSAALPARRKERSISSLVVSTPRVSTKVGMTGRRTKAVARKAATLRGSTFSAEKPIKREEDSEEEDDPETESSPETLNKFTQIKRQSSSSAEPSQAVSNKETGDRAEPWDGKLDLWKPLNCLVEVANRTKSFKSSSQGSDSKSEPTHVIDNEAQAGKTKTKENRCNSRLQDEKNGTDPTPSETVSPKKLRRIRRRRSAASSDVIISPQVVLDAASTKRERTGPVWFSLMAADDHVFREGQAPLPQIPSSYLRIKDGNVPVSFIQKYLMMKLGLTTEAEVEIRCMGQPVVPTLQISNLVDLWLQTSSPAHRVPAVIGSSAKEFVMVLTYARKSMLPK